MTTAQVQTALEAPIVRPVLIARFDIAVDPVLGWTGPGLFAPTGTGDAALDGQIFDPQEAPVEVSDFVDNQGIGEAVTITMSAVDLDQDVLRQLVRDRRNYLGRKAWIWFGLLDDTEAAVLPDPERLKTGVIVSMSRRRLNGEEVVDIVIDEDLGGRSGSELRIIDHTRFHAGDTFSSFVLKLVNRPSGVRATIRSSDVADGPTPSGPTPSGTGISTTNFR